MSACNQIFNVFFNEKKLKHTMLIKDLDNLNFFKFAYGGQILGLSQSSLLPQLPRKMTFASKVVEIDSKIIILLCQSKYVTHSVEFQLNVDRENLERCNEQIGKAINQLKLKIQKGECTFLRKQTNKKIEDLGNDIINLNPNLFQGLTQFRDQL